MNSPLALERLERRELLHGGEVLPSITIDTQVGSVTIELFHEDAPLTVQNFLNYVHDGDYTDMFFHRDVAGFVLQGGGFTVGSPEICDDPCNTSTVDISSFAEVPTDNPVVNEFGISNTRGTVAMAKLGGDPDSATSQFFVNLSDNSANLDFQNGGFTVFGQVSDMTVVDEISALGEVDLSSLFPTTSRLRAVGAAPVFVNSSSRTEIVSTQAITGTAVLEGTVFNDFDGDGVMDASDGGMFRRTVFIDANGNGALDANETSTETDELGEFHLVVSTAGSYDVRMVNGTDYGQTISVAASGYDRTVDVGDLAASLDFGMRYTGTSWTNPLINTDIDGINGTTPLDALTVINELTLREFSDPQTGALPTLTSTPASPIFLDVVGNGAVGPLDANFVVSNLISTADPRAVAQSPLGVSETAADPNSESPTSDNSLVAPIIAVQQASDSVDRDATTLTVEIGLTNDEGTPIEPNELVAARVVEISASASSDRYRSSADDSSQQADDELKAYPSVDALFAELGS